MDQGRVKDRKLSAKKKAHDNAVTKVPCEKGDPLEAHPYDESCCGDNGPQTRPENWIDSGISDFDGNRIQPPHNAESR